MQRLEKLGHHEASNEDEWASALHALKGIAINLGAEPLASMVDYDKNQGRMERVKKLREEQEKVLSFLAGVAADGSTGQ